MGTMAALPTLVALVAASDTGLRPGRLYNGVDRPVPITVAAPDADAALVVLDADGAVIAGPVAVQAGPADLGKLLPQVWGLRRSAWVQLLVAEEAAGSPLVVQPMLSRMVPVVEEAINPNGIRYTRIVGWRSELDPLDEAKEGDEPADEEPAAPKEPKRLMTGLRIYADRDIVLHTTLGAIRLALRPDEAPNTCWNFRELCEGGFYTGVVFHRVVPLTRDGHPFVIQAGDPTATGDGGPGYWLPIEPSALRHEFGVISMARDVAPDSAGSQIFICLSREGTARLDGHYCAFGETVEGAETIRAIAAVELADPAAGRPVDPPVIERAELVPAPPRRPGVGRPDMVTVGEEPAPATQPKRVPR
jgi:peptidyl-prolyl cis-trans isomerase B (cyclophilin B)